MNRRLFAVLAGFLLAVSAHAQIVVMDYDMFQSNRNIKVKLSVQDARTEEPLPFATVYLNPQGDTTITHFALSDPEGKVEIPDVPVGRYRLNVELIGGLKTAAMAGANLNSARLKGLESTASVSYNFSDQLSGYSSARQSTLVGEDPLFTNGRLSGGVKGFGKGFGKERRYRYAARPPLRQQRQQPDAVRQRLLFFDFPERLPDAARKRPDAVAQGEQPVLFRRPGRPDAQ